MFDELTPAEIATLRQLADRGSPVADTRLDADAVRSLGMRGFARRLSGFAVITPDGRRALEAVQKGRQPERSSRALEYRPPQVNVPAPTPAAVEEPGDEIRVNTAQEDMLRQLALAEGPVPFDDLDGRVVRALEGRGLVSKDGGLVGITDEGRSFYESKVRRRRRARSGWVREAVADETADRSGRAQSIRDAVDALRRAIGSAETIEIGDLDAPAESAFEALLELADRIDRGADPRRITRR